jgi:hypothetical protein
LLNDNNFEYSQFPTIISSPQTFQKLEKQKVKNKRKKFKKGFSKLNTLVTIKTNILNSLKVKLKKQKHYLKAPANNLTYLPQSSYTIKPLQPTLLLNFQFSKLVNFSSLLIKYSFFFHKVPFRTFSLYIRFMNQSIQLLKLDISIQHEEKLKTFFSL